MAKRGWAGLGKGRGGDKNEKQSSIVRKKSFSQVFDSSLTHSERCGTWSKKDFRRRDEKKRKNTTSWELCQQNTSKMFQFFFSSSFFYTVFVHAKKALFFTVGDVADVNSTENKCTKNFPGKRFFSFYFHEIN